MVEVNTKILMAGTSYNRVITLHTNGSPQIHTIPIQVDTANLPIRSTNVSLLPLLLLFSFVVAIVGVLFSHVLPNTLTTQHLKIVIMGVSIGLVIGLQGAAWTLKNAKTVVGSQLVSWTAIFLAIPTVSGVWFFLEYLMGSWEVILSGLVAGIFTGWALGISMGITVEKLLTQSIHKVGASIFVLVTSLLAIAVSLGFVIGFQQPVVLLSVTLLSITLGSILINAPLNHAKRVADYRKFERNRIRP